MKILHRNAYRPPQALSKRPLLHGVFRFGLYVVLQALVFSGTARTLGLVLLITVLFGWLEGLSWCQWLRTSAGLLIMALAPALAGFPYSLLFTAGAVGSWSGLPLPDWLVLWQPSLLRSLRFLLVFVTAAWLSHAMTALALRAVLETVLIPFGRRIRTNLARAAGLVLAFLPWTREELQRAGEAVRLRGCNPRRQPLRYLGALAVPVALRSLERARHSAEALLLRDTSLAAAAGLKDESDC